MHSINQILVGNLWLVCGFMVTYYTGLHIKSMAVCRNSLFVLKTNTPKPQPYPHPNYQINRSNFVLTHITHRTYKNNDYLYKYIIYLVILSCSVVAGVTLTLLPVHASKSSDR